MRLYLSGPMTGIENYNFPEFFRIGDRLRELGHEVESPAEYDIKNGWVLAEYLIKGRAGSWQKCHMSWNSTPDKFHPCEAINRFEHRFTATELFDYESALVKDCELVRTCDGIIMMPGWEQSGGAKRELSASINANLFVYEWHDDKDPNLVYLSAADASRRIHPPAETYKSATDEPMPHELLDVGVIPGAKTRTLRSPEVHEAIGVFTDLLLATLGDGSDKRMQGLKPSWKVDEHMSHVYSHLGKYAKGEVIDPDSGVHTLAHAACRLLFVAASETAEMGNIHPAPPDASLDYSHNPYLPTRKL